jgi:hypothetical protein
VYKTNHKDHGSIERYKARLVVKDYSQKLGIDYNDTFSTITMLDILSFFLAQCNWLNITN